MVGQQWLQRGEWDPIQRKTENRLRAPGGCPGDPCIALWELRPGIAKIPVENYQSQESMLCELEQVPHALCASVSPYFQRGIGARHLRPLAA